MYIKQPPYQIEAKESLDTNGAVTDTMTVRYGCYDYWSSHEAQSTQSSSAEKSWNPYHTPWKIFHTAILG